ncbi:MAG TPA: COX15/CtaA family protein [Chitinophagaceae bacterium]|nr:COX15/CtaA family protein [Chitinophagaceae bacterium]
MQTTPRSSSSRAVAIWIMIGVGMLLVQVILGGITRLTGSGLSITEWDVVTGFLPPLNEQQWATEFEKYRQTPQFRYINMDFTLSDFKFIFFWEWFHRFWGRLIAIAFAIPFTIFLIQKRFTKNMIGPLLLLFLFGALQGAIGWIMVKSGLTGDAIYVKPTRLALHFVFALALIAYAFWFGLQLLVPQYERAAAPSLRKLTGWMIGLVFIQFVFGALMAGHKAANAAPTWPTINGEWIPSNLFAEEPFLFNFVDNRITIHFVHRLLAYVLTLLAFTWTVKAYRAAPMPRLFTATRWLPAIFIIIQVFLGIYSLWASKHIVPNQWGGFEWVAQLHQLTGMLFLLSLVWMYYLLRKNPLPALAGIR